MLRNTGGEVITIDGNQLPGITTCNVPIGLQQLVKGYLSQRMTKITSGFESVDYWLRHARPDFTIEFAQQ